ncbi:piggyBac transposable element-derived protein 3-like [Macrosteles quadrilineatus]|nr:piggyBac transposable element-derived protein 3-like [Macrosteles quadrilineatus]
MASRRTHEDLRFNCLNDEEVDQALNELVGDLDLDQSDFEDIGDDEPDMMPHPRGPRNMGLSLEELLGDCDDDTDEDPDYNPDLEDIPSSDSECADESAKPKRKRDTKNYGQNASGKKKKKTATVKPADPGPKWTAKSFKPEEIKLMEPSYKKEECDDSWDDDTFVYQYFDDELLDLMVLKTNQTSIHITGKSLKLTLQELKIWIGMNCVMSALNFPQIRMYWEKRFRIPCLASAMTRDRFYAIRTSLKVVFDNDFSDEEKKTNRLWKVRPVLDRVLQGCMNQPRQKELCVDEMMVPFQGTCALKQYVPNKPNPVGLKVFVLANPNGVICDFKIYQGKNTFPEETSQGFSLGEAAVMYLSRSLVPGHTLYFDRYFTTTKLADALLDQGIRCSGTIMKNRVPKNTDLVPDKEFKKSERGSSQVSVREDGKMAVTKWLDNKPVSMLSTSESKEPQHQVKRWNKKEKKYITVSQPAVINSYNKNMGGVDLADRIMSYCPNRSKTKKWTIRCIMHFFDLAMSNAWLQMREFKRSQNVRPKDIPQFRAFKLAFGVRLIEQNLQDDNESCGSELEECDAVHDVGDGRKVATPSIEVRTRGAIHLPQVTTGVQKRCRRKNCGKKTSVFCIKCNVYLCLMGNRNCFSSFHSK